jgi:hypothetical protein
VAVQSVCSNVIFSSEVVFSEQTSTGHAAFDPCPARPCNADRALLTAAHRAVSAFPSLLIGIHLEKAR